VWARETIIGYSDGATERMRQNDPCGGNDAACLCTITVADCSISSRSTNIVKDRRSGCDRSRVRIECVEAG